MGISWLSFVKQIYYQTAFIVLCWAHGIKRMPFGFSRAPTTFQKLIKLVLATVFSSSDHAYLDDIIITLPMFEKHLALLQVVFLLLQEAIWLNEPGRLFMQLYYFPHCNNSTTISCLAIWDGENLKVVLVRPFIFLNFVMKWRGKCVLICDTCQWYSYPIYFLGDFYIPLKQHYRYKSWTRTSISPYHFSIKQDCKYFLVVVD